MTQRVLFSSPGEFLDPASLPLEPVSSAEARTTAGSGQRLADAWPKSGPLGRCSRILLESETWASLEYSLKWKPSATKCGCLVFRLVPSARHTAGSDTGLSVGWQTPRETDTPGADYTYPNGDHSRPFLCNPGLLKVKMESTWPTPKQPQGSACRTEKNMGHLHRMDDVTPTSGEITSGCLARTESFVERLMTLSAWLMGYTGAYLAHWETASSRKSRRESSQP